MTRKCYKLIFESPLHISSGGFALEGVDAFVRSDTLFSALCATAAMHWGDERRLADFFFPENGQQTPGFRLSSAFPYFDDIFFLPKPYFLDPKDENGNELEHSVKKRVGKARFMDAKLWDEMADGKQVAFYENEMDLCAATKKIDFIPSTIKNRCWTNRPWPAVGGGDIYEEYERPRVVVDRVSSDGTIFHFGEIRFREKAGLYFMADFENENDVKPFEVLLNLLGENGLGADRTVGRGLFTFEETQAPLALNEESNTEAFVSLSLFIPMEDEMKHLDFEDSWYDYTLRRGWVSNQVLRRRTMRMFTEGSAFRLKQAGTSKGRVAKALDKDDLNIGHDVWRSGLCFPVPVPASLLKEQI